jgi:hypothetical protein
VATAVCPPSSDFINALYSETSSQFDANVLSESKIIRVYRYFKTELDSHLGAESDLTEFLDRTFDKVEVLLLNVEPDDRPAAICSTRDRQTSSDCRRVTSSRDRKAESAGEGPEWSRVEVCV